MWALHVRHCHLIWEGCLKAGNAIPGRQSMKALGRATAIDIQPLDVCAGGQCPWKKVSSDSFCAGLHVLTPGKRMYMSPFQDCQLHCSRCQWPQHSPGLAYLRLRRLSAVGHPQTQSRHHRTMPAWDFLQLSSRAPYPPA